MSATTGYSGTPLDRKLGLKLNMKVLLINQPDHYKSLFPELPHGITYIHEGDADFIHAFYTRFASLKRDIQFLCTSLKKGGMLWISWPKGKSSIETDLNRDILREFVLETGLVDIKVAAIDDDWSALKFVHRKSKGTKT